jgi:capsule polysaccharide export protein KpsE/RkpR
MNEEEKKQRKQWKKLNPRPISEETKLFWWVLWVCVLFIGWTYYCLFRLPDEFFNTAFIMAIVFFITGLLFHFLFRD